MPEPVTLIIAHSHPVFRGILQNILRSQPGFHVIGEACTAAELLEAATSMQPHIIIAGISLAGTEGFTVLDKLAASCKGVKVIISWRYRDEEMLSAAMSAMCAGYISHDAPPGDYFFAIKQVMKGEVFYCRQTEKLRTPQKQLFDTDASLHTVNEKYLMLVYCSLMGFSIKETALAIALSENTVKTYRKRFTNSIGSHSIAALVSFMKKNGMM